MELDFKQESLFIQLNETDRLHLKHFYQDLSGPVVFMLHGSIENGKIFYSNSGKGFAPFLARHGFDVYVADLRGRGQSTPRISRDSDFGQTEAITEDLPAFLAEIKKIRGEEIQHWVGHSWGGVILASYFSRFPEYCSQVKSMVFFGTKRVISVFNRNKFINIDLFWHRFAKLLTKIYGYLPAGTMFGVGSDHETVKSHAGTLSWIKGGSWIDSEDGFAYGERIKNTDFPPVLSLTGKADDYLGHPTDVKKFLAELQAKNSQFILLGKSEGNFHDYGHIDILTNKDAVNDHFPHILEWLKKYSVKK